jgi:crotonobetainyl-CoA:carnitine CoA-transferase CaiB-like acyl-CoA transferase
MSYEAPFARLRVLDVSQGVAAPYAAMLLAQYGADVIKVEPPVGDWSRTLGTRYGDHSAFSLAANLGKRSIALDLANDEGKRVVRKLAERADVFIESFRPGGADKLGVGWAAISALNPRVIYMSVSGFGQNGPDRERPAVDTIVQAFTGLMDVNRGADGIPHRVGNIVMDMATALYTFQAIAVALYARRDEPRGRRLESSLIQGGAALQVVRMMSSSLEGGTTRPGLTPSGVFKTADGWMAVSILRDADFPTLCDVLGIPDVKTDPRFANNDLRFTHSEELMARLGAAFASAPCEDWQKRFRDTRIMNDRVNTYLDFLRHPHVEATNLVAWLDHPDVGRIPVPNAPGLTPPVSGTRRARAPRLDEHRKEILAELGLN